MPELAAPIRAKAQDVEHLSRVVQTYHAPDSPTALARSGRRRFGNGVVLAIDMADVIHALERAEGDSSSPDGRVTTLPFSASDWRFLPNRGSQL